MKSFRKIKCKSCGSTGPSQKFCIYCSSAFCASCGAAADGLYYDKQSQDTCPVCENKGGVIRQIDREDIKV